MTDNKIIEALEEMTAYKSLNLGCRKILHHTIDLIFRLKNTNNALQGLNRAKQVEIERLKRDLEFYQKATHNLNKELTEREVKP